MGSHRILDVRQVPVSVLFLVMVSSVQGQDVGTFLAGLLGSSDIPSENSTFQFPPCPGECVHVITSILCPHVIEELNCGASYLRCCVPNDFNFGTVVETSPPLPEDVAPGTILPNYDPFPETPPPPIEGINSMPSIAKQPQTTASFSPVQNHVATTSSMPPMGVHDVHRPYHNSESQMSGKPCPGICVESPFDRYCSSIISDAVCDDGSSKCCASSSDPLPPPAPSPPRLPVAPVSPDVSWNNHTILNNKRPVTTIPPPTTTTTTETTVPALTMTTTMTPLDQTTIPGPICPGTCVAPLFSLLCDAVVSDFYCPNEGRCCVSDDEETSETTTTTTTTTTQPPIPSCPGTCIPAFLSGVCNKPSELIVRTDCEASFICCYIPNVKEEDMGILQRPPQSPLRPHPSQSHYTPNPRPPSPIRRPLPPPHQQHQHIPIPRPPSSPTSHLPSQHSSYSPPSSHNHPPSSSSSQGYRPHPSSSSSTGHHPYPPSSSYQGHRPQVSPSSSQGHHPHLSTSSSQGHHPHLSPSSSQGHHPHISSSSSQGSPSHSLPSSSEEFYPRPPPSSDQGYHPPSFIPISSVHKPVPPQASTIPQPLSTPPRPTVPPQQHPTLLASPQGSRPHVPLSSSHPEDNEESSRPVVILSQGSRPLDAEESPICPGPCIAPFLRFTCFGNNAIYNGFSCMKTGTVCCAPVSDIERFEESLRIAEASGGGRPSITPTVKPAVTTRRPDPYVCGVKGSSRQETPRVMGGSTSSPGEWCWQVALINAQNQYLCGGALIGSRWVLTAAHCITSLVRNGDPIYVRVGDYDLASQYGSPGAQTHRVSTSYIHHNHNGQTLDNDIALLRLENPADLNDSVCLVCLPARGATSDPGKRCTVTGYGYESESGPISLKIREAKLPIVADKTCSEQVNAVTEKLFILPTGSFCAGGEDGNDACQGDGGGPLVCETDGFYELMGLVSWGFGCGKQDVPGVYVKVSSFIGWINQIISVNN